MTEKRPSRNEVLLADGGMTIILDEKKARRKRRLRLYVKLGVFGFIVLVFIVALIATEFVRADTLDFYPTSCLGNWQSVENALGRPDLPDGADPSNFNATNSAVYAGGDTQIFCGNFSGDDPGAKVFQKATIHFTWNFVLPAPPSSTAAVSSTETSTAAAMSVPAGGGGGGGGSVSVSPADSTTVASTTVASTTATSTDDNATTTATSTVTLSVTASTSTDTSTTTASSSIPAPTDTTTTQATTTDTAADQATTTLPATDTPPAPPPPEPMPADTSTPPATSFLSRFISIAFAADPTSTESSSLAIPFDPTIPLVSSTAPITQVSSNDIFQITISLDGKTWIPLGTVSAADWQNVSYDLPIQSWSELAELQVGIKGLSSAAVTDVFLDGMTVTAEYDMPDAVREIVRQPKTLPSPAPVIDEPPIFDPRAKQTCLVDPFSVATTIGGTAHFGVTLVPSETPHPAFTVKIGDLPQGVTGTITPSSTNPLAPAISLAVDGTATTGSYNVVFLYTETATSGIALPNYCQFNLVIQ